MSGSKENLPSKKSILYAFSYEEKNGNNNQIIGNPQDKNKSKKSLRIEKQPLINIPPNPTAQNSNKSPRIKPVSDPIPKIKPNSDPNPKIQPVSDSIPKIKPNSDPNPKIQPVSDSNPKTKPISDPTRKRKPIPEQLNFSRGYVTNNQVNNVPFPLIDEQNNPPNPNQKVLSYLNKTELTNTQKSALKDHRVSLQRAETRMTDYALDQVRKSIGLNRILMSKNGVSRFANPKETQIAQIIRATKPPCGECSKAIPIAIKPQIDRTFAPVREKHFHKKKKISKSIKELFIAEDHDILDGKIDSWPILMDSNSKHNFNNNDNNNDNIIFENQPKKHNASSAIIPQQRPLRLIKTELTDIAIIHGHTHYLHENLDSPMPNLFSKPSDPRAPGDETPLGQNRWRTVVDMHGFGDDEISFQTEGRAIFITGARSGGKHNPRKVTEIVELPHFAFADKLRITRNNDGSLLIEERFSE